MINTRWLFIGGCIALVTSAFTFSLHGDIMQDMGRTFNFTQEQNGDIGQSIFYGMALSMFLGGFVCDALGMKRIMLLACLSHLVGSLGMIFSKEIVGAQSAAYWWLYASGLLMGCGNGLTEVWINPLVATAYSRDKTHYLNILHAWWPGGLMIGGLLAIVMRTVVFQESSETLLFGLELWQASLFLIVIPALVYGVGLLGSQFPVTERVESGVSTEDMIRQTIRPMFLLWAFCMLLTAATELGPQKWQNSVMTRTANVSGTAILVYTSLMMFVLRHFAGPIAHRLSPVGMLTGSAVLSAIGLFLLSHADSTMTAFGYATIYGLGIAYFWPTMLGVAAERFPKGGALILALMGTAGNISIALVLPRMGAIYDHYTAENISDKVPGAVVVEQMGDRTVESAAGELAAASELLRGSLDAQPRDDFGVAESFLKYRQAHSTLEGHLLPLIIDNKPNPAALEAIRAPLEPLLAPLAKIGFASTRIDEALEQKSFDVLIADFEAQGGELDQESRRRLKESFNTAKANPALVNRFLALETAQAEGAAMAFRWVSILPAVLILLFGVIALVDKARGGHKPELLSKPE